VATVAIGVAGEDVYRRGSGRSEREREREILHGASSSAVGTARVPPSRSWGGFGPGVDLISRFELISAIVLLFGFAIDCDYALSP